MFSQIPEGILVISAHWDTLEPAVNTIHGRHDAIHDFYGFPKPMYKAYRTLMHEQRISFPDRDDCPYCKKRLQHC